MDSSQDLLKYTKLSQARIGPVRMDEVYGEFHRLTFEITNSEIFEKPEPEIQRIFLPITGGSTRMNIDSEAGRIVFHISPYQAKNISPLLKPESKYKPRKKMPVTSNGARKDVNVDFIAELSPYIMNSSYAHSNGKLHINVGFNNYENFVSVKAKPLQSLIDVILGVVSDNAPDTKYTVQGVGMKGVVPKIHIEVDGFPEGIVKYSIIEQIKKHPLFQQQREHGR